MGTQLPSPKGAHPPPIFGTSVAVQWLQPAWIKMALGMEVGLGPSHIVLDGDPLDRETDRTGQRPDSIGQTVLQTVAQKLPMATPCVEVW